MEWEFDRWVANGDCLERMKEIPDGSVDMVLTDPPYGTMAGAGLDGWGKTKTDWDVALEPAAFLEQCNRILRMNGALVLFSQEPYTSRLVTEAHGNLPFSYRMAWLKDHFANALIAKTAPVSYFEDILVFFKKYDTQGLHPVRAYASRVLEHCGGSLKDINAELGHRRAEHFFYVVSTQFSLCTEEVYEQLCARYDLASCPWFHPYTALAQMNADYTRRFNLPPGQRFKSNVLQFRKDYDGFHPTQKPVALLEDLATTYTDEGDVVLDFTMGSGSTGVACANTGRKFIGIERDPDYYQLAVDRIHRHYVRDLI